MAPTAAVESYNSPHGFPATEKVVSTKPTDPVKFDPAKHLDYSPPSSILTMKDLSLGPTPLSNVASTVPFKLLSREGVLQHRRELFQKDVMDNCLHHTRPGSVQLRGMAPRYAPFIHEFWNSPEVLKIISSLAQVDLVPVMSYETSHCNVQMGPNGVEGVKVTPVEPPVATGDAIAKFENDKPQPDKVTDQTKPIIEWHKDSHPFVCVVMLSHAQHMVGGETEVMKGDGKTLKIKAPGMGSACILQGRYISHTAAPVSNIPERVTIVTSFRPWDPTLVDDSTNANIRNKSHLSELYYQWTTYRLQVLSERARIAAEALKQRYEKNVQETDPEGKPGMCLAETVNVEEVEKWVNEQINYMKQTLYEMRPIGQ